MFPTELAENLAARPVAAGVGGPDPQSAACFSGKVFAVSNIMIRVPERFLAGQRLLPRLRRRAQLAGRREMSDRKNEDSGTRYRAFISYSRVDRKVATTLQQRLERYVLPKALRLAQPGLNYDRRPLKPIFRDEDELVPGQDLSARIRHGLRSSEFLIVVCSPSAAISEWVEEEVREFIGLGKRDSILGVIVSGEPGAATRGQVACLECMPPSMREPEPLWSIGASPLSTTESTFCVLLRRFCRFARSTI
jgi:MTH538 TIR-like domain (DUF1863)